MATRQRVDRVVRKAADKAERVCTISSSDRKEIIVVESGVGVMNIAVPHLLGFFGCSSFRVLASGFWGMVRAVKKAFSPLFSIF
jgi:hypothetical protein